MALAHVGKTIHYKNKQQIFILFHFLSRSLVKKTFWISRGKPKMSSGISHPPLHIFYFSQGVNKSFKIVKKIIKSK